jgi:hypothetical protein
VHVDNSSEGRQANAKPSVFHSVPHADVASRWLIGETAFNVHCSSENCQPHSRRTYVKHYSTLSIAYCSYDLQCNGAESPDAVGEPAEPRSPESSVPERDRGAPGIQDGKYSFPQSFSELGSYLTIASPLSEPERCQTGMQNHAREARPPTLHPHEM